MVNDSASSDFSPARRAVLQGMAACAAASALPVQASELPKTIRILVGFPPGGGTDAIARALAEPLREALGVSIVVENKPGAGGQLAAQALKAAPADGSTLFLSHDHSISILPQTVKNAGFNPEKDFLPVAGFASFVNALALSAGTPATSFREFLNWVRTSEHGRTTIGVPAPASTPEFAVKTIAKQERLDLAAAPYRGSAPMLADMLGNQIPAGVASVPDFIEYHRAGKVRVVAVAGQGREPLLPDVPTFAELGIRGFELPPYYGLFAPAGTPSAFVQTFAEALAKVLKRREVHARLLSLGLRPQWMTSNELAQRERDYRATWSKIIQASGFVAQ